MNAEDRFWSKVEKTDTCWFWTGATSDSGHGVISIDGKLLNTHRYSYELAFGPVPDKMNVFQSCKHRHCVNPNHLLLGTRNMFHPSTHKKQDEVERFWGHVQKPGDEIAGCWVWTSTLYKNYGMFYVKSRGIRATHYSWKLYTGRPVPKGLIVCHHCDHPWCVNPLHLFIGTQNDNVQDMVMKGRNAKGKKQGLSKLTREQADEIRNDTTTSKCALARKYGVSRTTIQHIHKGTVWK